MTMVIKITPQTRHQCKMSDKPLSAAAAAGIRDDEDNVGDADACDGDAGDQLGDAGASGARLFVVIFSCSAATF